MKSKIALLITSLLFSYGVYAQDQTKLIVWEDPQRIEVLEQSVKSFEEENNCEVVFKAVDMHEQLNKYLEIGASSERPDILMLPSDKVADAESRDLIVPIQFMQVEALNYLQNAVASISINGICYCVPKAIETLVIFYNKDLLPTPPKTVAEYFALSEERQKENKYGLLANYHQFYSIFPLMSAYGAHIFENYSTESKIADSYGLDNEGAQEAFRLLRHIYKKGFTIELPRDFEVAFDILYRTFKSGDAFAVIDGPWNLNKYIKSGVNLGITTLPSLSNGRALSPLLSVKGWVILKSSKNPDLSEKLLQFLNSDQVALSRYMETKEIPPIITVLKSNVLSDDKLVEAIAEQSLNSVSMPSVPQMEYIWSNMDQALQELYETEDSEESILKRARKRFESSVVE